MLSSSRFLKFPSGVVAQCRKSTREVVDDEAELRMLKRGGVHRDRGTASAIPSPTLFFYILLSFGKEREKIEKNQIKPLARLDCGKKTNHFISKWIVDQVSMNLAVT